MLERIGRVTKVVKPRGNTRFCLVIAKNSKEEFFATVPVRYLDSLSSPLEGRIIRMNRKGYIEVIDNQSQSFLQQQAA
jgi:hypothetical protein